MIQLIAPLLFAVLTFAPLIQDGSKSESQSNKTNSTRHDSQRKKKVSPPAAPKPAQPEADKPTLQYNQTNTEDSDKHAHNWIDFLNAISTAVVAAFTVVLSIVGVLQFRATRTAERAWIVSDPPTDSAPPSGDIQLSWTMANKGRTPAWITALGAAAQTVAPGGELPKKPPYTMAGPFPPNGTPLTPDGIIERGLTIPNAQWAQIVLGQVILYVFGTVEYRDSFKGKHETRFCFRFHPGPTATNPSPRGFYVDGPEEYLRAT